MDQLFSFVLLMLLFPSLYSKPHMDHNTAMEISVVNDSVEKPDHVLPVKDLFWAKGNQSCYQLLKDCTEYLDLLPSTSSQFTKPALALGLMQVGCLAETDHLYLDLLRDEDTISIFKLLTEQLRTSAYHHHKQKHVLELELLRYNLDKLFPIALPTHHQHCSGFQQENKNVILNGLELGLHSSLQEAKKHCHRLGPSCAGVYLDSLGGFHSVARNGGYITPQNETTLWLHHCTNAHRTRRSSDSECHSERELRIHNVMQWVPVVSGWYNAGSAIYYATQGCAEQAENRAVEASLDLSSDALLMATGGTSGAVRMGIGLAVKPALKAGVKAAIDYFKHESQ